MANTMANAWYCAIELSGAHTAQCVRDFWSGDGETMPAMVIVDRFVVHKSKYYLHRIAVDWLVRWDLQWKTLSAEQEIKGY